jgi:hypothetical protein
MAFEDREMENVSAALLGLMRSVFELWSEGPGVDRKDQLAVECTRARAEFERALSVWVGARGGWTGAPSARGETGDRAAETSVGDAPLVIPLEEARTLFETFYVLGGLALFDGNQAKAARALRIDPARLAGYEHSADELRTRASELWSTACGLAQTGVDRLR